jgi:hypothetical protein
VGQGTYSSVYAVRDARTGATRALKKVRLDTGDDDAIAFAAREVRAPVVPARKRVTRAALPGAPALTRAPSPPPRAGQRAAARGPPKRAALRACV